MNAVARLAPEFQGVISGVANWNEPTPLQEKVLESFRILMEVLAGESDEKEQAYLLKMMLQLLLATQGLNLWGTGLQYGCDPRFHPDGYNMCLRHWVDSGAAERFEESYLL